MELVPRGRFGRPFRWLDSCPSTQREVAADSEGAVVAADEQTEGRGRLGRTWHAPKGRGLLFSVVLEPRVPAERLPELSLAAGEAVREAIRDIAGLDVAIKPPNDVLAGGRKVAGILAEASAGRVVLGVGVNVSQTADELPFGVDATSLALEGAHVERAELLATILERLERRYDAWVSACARDT